jgi:CheY-like chemotaxis protein
MDTPAASPTSPPTLRVLVADDNRDYAASTAELIRLWGYDCRVEHNGITALTQVECYMPDVILLDVTMPLMDGVRVAQAINKAPGGPKPVIIAISGDADLRLRREALSAGIDRYLLKPVEPADLQSLLATLAASTRRLS